MAFDASLNCRPGRAVRERVGPGVRTDFLFSLPNRIAVISMSVQLQARTTMTDGSHRRGDRLETLGWVTAAVLLAALAVPWFLWRDSTVVAGLPLWIWWHVGWMGLASVGFYTFTRYGWGVGVESVGPVTEGPGDGRDE